MSEQRQATIQSYVSALLAGVPVRLSRVWFRGRSWRSETESAGAEIDPTQQPSPANASQSSAQPAIADSA